MAVVEKVRAPHDGSGPLMRQFVLAYLCEEGTASAQAGLRQRAEEYLQRALALDGENADLWALLGTVVDGPVRAACARQALALDPEHRQAQDLLAETVSTTVQEPVFRLPTPSLRPGGRSVALVRKPVRRTMLQAIAPPLPRPVASAAPQVSSRVFARFVAGLILLLVVILDIGLASAYAHKYAERIFPGVSVAGLDVGGLPPAEAEHLLHQQVAPSLNWPILLRFGGQTWSFTAAEVGLRYRVTEASQEASAVGRQGSVLQVWWERMRVGLEGQEVPLLAEVRAERLRAVLDQLAAALDRTAIAPSVFRQEADWVIVPGQDGRHIVREELEQRLLTALAALIHGEGPPPGTPVVIDVPVVVDTTALSEDEERRLRSQLDQAGRPLVLRCEEHTWTLEAAQIAGWLHVQLGPPPGSPSVQIDREALRDFLLGLAPEVSVPVQLAQMEVSDGRVVAFRMGQDGRRLDLDAAVDQMEQAFQRRLAGEDVEAVELTAEVIPSGIDAIMAELGVVELVGEGTSTFVGSSANRANNILIGGRDLHGLLIAPGEVFSLNDALSPITWEKGYRSSAIIGSGGYVYYGLGGGLCQVATTMYRAALYSGLEIVERHTHLWRVEYYEQDAPPGFDATILLGGPDLRFRNNTGHYLLIQVETNLDESRQTIRFYGTSPGWKVTVDDLVINSGGNAVSYVRTVTKDGQILSQETIYSYYY